LATDKLATDKLATDKLATDKLATDKLATDKPISIVENVIFSTISNIFTPLRILHLFLFKTLINSISSLAKDIYIFTN